MVPSKKGGSWVYFNATKSLVVDVGVELPFVPLALRYGWSDFEECLLVNGEGVPLAPLNVKCTLHIKIKDAVCSTSFFFCKL